MTPDYPKPPFPAQKQSMPGSTGAMQPRPDHGESSYKGSGKLKGMKAVITGGDSGIGRAIAIACGRFVRWQIARPFFLQCRWFHRGSQLRSQLPAKLLPCRLQLRFL